MNYGFLEKIKTTFRDFQPVHRPNFIIIGAQKAGTTTLHYYLNQHPDISGSVPKEIHFFNRDFYFGKSVESYEKHFRGWRAKKYFEATPAYLYIPDTYKVMHDLYPDLKLIAILRDPVKRAYSAWSMYKYMFDNKRTDEMIKSKPCRNGDLLYKKLYEGREVFPSCRECIDIELGLIKSGEGFEPAILRRGLYIDQLNHYWNSFGKEKILILGFNDLVKDTKNTLKKITDFLEIKDAGWSFLQKEPRNTRSYSESILESDKKFLEDFYRQPNKELFDTVGHINW